MFGFFCATYLAIVTSHLQAATSTVRIQVQYLEWKSPTEGGSFGVFSVVPNEAKVFGSIRVSAVLGRNFHAEAQIGKETITLNGVARATKTNEIEIEIEPGYSKENAVAGVNPKLVVPGRDMWKTHTECRLKPGDVFVVRKGLETRMSNTGVCKTNQTGFAVKVIEKGPSVEDPAIRD